MSSRSIGQLSFSRVIRRVSLTLAVTLGALSLNATAANATDPVWTTVSAQLTDTQSMSASDDGSHILVSSWFHLNISTDFGVTWTTKSPGTAGSQGWQTVAVSGDGSSMFADNTSVADSGLWRSDDAGLNWAKVNALPIAPFGTSISSDARIMFTTDYATGEMWCSSNSDVTWAKSTRQSTLPGGWVSGFVSPDGSTIVAINDADLYVSKNQGSTWTKRRSKGSKVHTIDGVALSSNGSTIAITQEGNGVTDLGSVAVSKNYGTTWKSSSSTNLPNGTETWIAISADGHRIVTAEPSHEIWLSTNSGSTWTHQNVAITGTIQGISSSLMGDVVTIYQEKTAIYRENFRAPSAPTITDVTFPAARKATITWSIPADNGARITKYEYCYLKCSKSSSWKSTGLVTSVTLKRIKKNSSVTINIRARNSNGKGSVISTSFTQTK